MAIVDLVVVGAGPAGSNAAAVALQAGLSVIQIERMKFPRKKPCGGGLSNKCFNSLQIPIPSTLYRQFFVIESNVWNREINRFSHRNVVLRTVVRPAFDNYLVKENLRRDRFVFYDNEAVRAITHDGVVFRVITPKRTIVSRQLIAADGANGIVNRVFRVSSPRFAYAVEVNLTKDVARETRGSLNPCIDFGVIKNGYGWVFPKDDQWSVGIYALSGGFGISKRSLRNT